MTLPARFFCAQKEYGTYEKHVNAPMIRKVFEANAVKEAYILIGTTGFYDLYLNGEKITKGLLAPYISNPDHYVCFDRYDIGASLKEGKNTVVIILGNGIQNSNGGRVWDFDIARFRGVPRFAFSLTTVDESGNESVIEADESFKTMPSPVIFDDMRSGCFYDANLEVPEFFGADFDDSGLESIFPAESPRGELVMCGAEPVVVTEEIEAAEIREGVLSKEFGNRENMRLDTQFKFDYRGKKGVIFDFGINTAGICRLKINGRKGQEIFIQFCEFETSAGEPSYKNTGSFYPDGYGQTLLYICRGGECETFEPPFTYFGYRYAVVFGLEKEQISSDTLVMLRASSDLKERAGFDCSDPVMNALGKMSRVSDLANFYYFPTDCPHREKNGWTGDAAVSAERMILTLTPDSSYKQWLRSICAAQRADGALPGIVPTGGWGFAWGNGPAWDNVLTELCWQMYRVRGDLSFARECSENMLRYLSYISQKRRSDGLIAIGLGDWLQPGKGAGDPVAPLCLTDSVMSLYIAHKSAVLFEKLGLPLHARFARELYESFRQAIRDNLIDFGTMTVRPRCQTAQAICIYYGVFDPCEIKQAGSVLADICRENGGFIDCGMIGMRALFHVLSDIGEGELAYRMITRPEYPSYGNFVVRGLTALPEDFRPDEDRDDPASLNHHFFGDIVSWFIQRVAGIRINPRGCGCCDFNISPDFIPSLDSASAFYDSPCGRVSVSWKQHDGRAEITVECPDEATGYIVLPAGWKFVSERTYGSLHGSDMTELKAGGYTAEKAL